MTIKQQATVADLYNVPEHGKAELVNGELVRMSPTGALPGYAGMQIVMSLHAYAQQTGRGYAIPDNVGFIVHLPHRESFSPDAAFYVGDLSMRFIEGAPLFAVEVRSEGDYGPAANREIKAKQRDYFEAGTLVVWDVDLLGEDVVKVFRADDPENPVIYKRGEVAEAAPAVPGWSMPVDDLFPH